MREPLIDRILTYVLFIPVIARLEQATNAPSASQLRVERYKCGSCDKPMILARARDCPKCGGWMRKTVAS
jgi:hypothetical protein